MTSVPAPIASAIPPLSEQASAKSIWRSPLVAATEALALVIGARLLQNLVMGIDSLPISPYFVCVLLMAAQYGVFGGILTAVLATAFTYAGGVPAPDLGESYFDYVLGLWRQPLIWVGVGLPVGLIVSHRLRAIAELKTALERARRDNDLMEQQYSILAHRARKLERRVAGLDAEEAAKSGAEALRSVDV